MFGCFSKKQKKETRNSKIKDNSALQATNEKQNITQSTTDSAKFTVKPTNEPSLSMNSVNKKSVRYEKRFLHEIIQPAQQPKSIEDKRSGEQTPSHDIETILKCDLSNEENGSSLQEPTGKFRETRDRKVRFTDTYNNNEEIVMEMVMSEDEIVYQKYQSCNLSSSLCKNKHHIPKYFEAYHSPISSEKQSHSDYSQAINKKIQKSIAYTDNNSAEEQHFFKTIIELEIQQPEQFNNTISLTNFRVQFNKILAKNFEDEDEYLLNETTDEAIMSFYCQNGDLNQQFSRALLDESSLELLKVIYSRMNSKSKNRKDSKGYSPIYLMILKAMVSPNYIQFAKKMIYDPEIILDCKGPLGWTPLQEAIFYRNIPIVTNLFKSGYQKKRQNIIADFKKIGIYLQSLQNFYLEIDIKIDSFIPLVSAFTPGDTIKILKVGKKLRMDYTLVGYEFLSCKRRNMCCIFDGDTGQLFGINNSKEIYCQLMEKLEQDELVMMVENLFTSQMKKMDPIFHSISLRKSLTLFQNQVHEIIAKTVAVKHILQINYTSTTQKRVSQIHPQMESLSFVKNFTEYIMKKEEIKIKDKNKNKNVELTLYLAKDFGFKLQDLVQIFSIFSVGNGLLDKSYKFLKQNILEKLNMSNEFPVKIDIPLSYSLFFNIEFKDYKTIDATDVIESFYIPSHYKRVSRKDYQNIKQSKEKKMALIQTYS